MTNAELIKGLRWCADESICCDDFSGEKCPYFDEKKDSCSVDEILHAAADALEAAEKRIAELEKRLPKEGECEAKKPKTVKETEYSFYCDCPTCGGRLISNLDGEWCAGSFDRFCRMCGQKIDWSEYCGRSNKPCGARMDGERKDGERDGES